MPRRGKGEGSIFQRKDGRWAAFVTIGYGPDGKQRKRWVYGRTRREVAEALARLLPRAGYGLIQPTRLRLGEWLERWADERARSKGLRPSTVQNYRNYQQLLKPLAATPLTRLSPLAIRARFAELAELSPSTRRHLYQFLRAALRDAVRVGLLEANPMDAVDPPTGGTVRPPRAWNREQVSAFLAAAQGHRLYPMFYVMLTTGLRIGEAMALRWQDWQGEKLWIRHTLTKQRTLGPTKTLGSSAPIYLDLATQTILSEHRTRQAEERATAKRWLDHDLIFPSEVGTPLSYRNVMRTFQALTEQAKVPRIGLHGLRHTYTSMALQAGLSPKQVADRLRHKDPALTLRIYQHLQEEDRRQAALNLDTLLHLQKQRLT
ncbi:MULTISPECIES: tyrosine-type recombinase/integrase [Meiothermus]|uniref:Integrase family protein n=4 Tax=Bacteria TaxID=2 RepID=D3PRT6_MEIRD|nr:MULTISPECIES: tyrosine-type recombinase/integrase [Meiothermus]GIW30934.1 MAG: site-specific integrase [Meiothermus sp.]ADD28169.1 integrase family protein [Meiothermus ruber DSM 1279]AGK04639.1 integrase family protein [Meiothermus ruber DSM 1279]AWR86807.1 integrase family protein [Meiothermus taiwanensis WR-220]KZK15409.1 integrase [Meiothermus taiwanensis]